MFYLVLWVLISAFNTLMVGSESGMNGSILHPRFWWHLCHQKWRQKEFSPVLTGCNWGSSCWVYCILREPMCKCNTIVFMHFEGEVWHQCSGLWTERLWKELPVQSARRGKLNSSSVSSKLFLLNNMCEFVFVGFVKQLWPLFGGHLTKPERGKLFYVPQVRVLNRSCVCLSSKLGFLSVHLFRGKWCWIWGDLWHKGCM